MDPSRPVLVLFCKQPRRGHGKQRLAAEIGTDNAFRIALGLLDCALEDAAAWSEQLVFAPSQSSEFSWAQSLARAPAFERRSVRVLPQTTGCLGERLLDMDFRLRNLGAEQIVFMASDAAGLQVEHLDLVVRELTRHDVVLADDIDGGVTLMASRCPWPRLQDLPWSTERLGDALAATCLSAGLRVQRLDGGFDIDTLDDMISLTDLLRRDSRPARRVLANLLRAELQAANA